jgi:hypothetical protein
MTSYSQYSGRAVLEYSCGLGYEVVEWEISLTKN